MASRPQTLYGLADSPVGLAAYLLDHGDRGGQPGVTIPAAITVFPGEQYQAPRSWAERAYSRLIYYHEADKGGHFAAWEEPQLFAEEMRAVFRSLRNGGS